MFPGKRNSLDALCDRFGISNAHRTLHGALLDSELLAEVYLAMTRGQESLVIDMLGDAPAQADVAAPRAGAALESVVLPVVAAQAEELAAHQAVLDDIEKATKGTSVWRREPAGDDGDAAVAQAA